jgi:hypothetical protein
MRVTGGPGARHRCRCPVIEQGAPHKIEKLSVASKNGGRLNFFTKISTQARILTEKEMQSANSKSSAGVL